VRDHSYHRTCRRVSLCKPMSHLSSKSYYDRPPDAPPFPVSPAPLCQSSVTFFYTPESLSPWNYLFSDPAKDKAISERNVFEITLHLSSRVNPNAFCKRSAVEVGNHPSGARRTKAATQALLHCRSSRANANEEELLYLLC
jgi:hypothetical protein